jgi:hypothetical protein
MGSVAISGRGSFDGGPAATIVTVGSADSGSRFHEMLESPTEVHFGGQRRDAMLFTQSEMYFIGVYLLEYYFSVNTLVFCFQGAFLLLVLAVVMYIIIVWTNFKSMYIEVIVQCQMPKLWEPGRQTLSRGCEP